MIRLNNIFIPLDGGDEAALQAARRLLRLGDDTKVPLRISKKSVDARDKSKLRFVYAVDAGMGGNEEALIARLKLKDAAVIKPGEPLSPPIKESALSPVVVGLGPCGLFAALYLARSGLKPLVLERGEPIIERARSVNALFSKGILNPQSNMQFGEGGAGTFSDGKLTTGIKDPFCRQVLEIFASHGAPEDILYLARPHIGTDRLPGVVSSIRKEIESLGGTVLFGAKLEGIQTSSNRLTGIVYSHQGKTLEKAANRLILALGHSARDTQEMLYKAGLHMQQKPFSIGLRLEQKQSVIDKAQYGLSAGHENLPAAEYHLSHRLSSGRGAYTFCMCPGGKVVNASSEPGLLCVNGMSPYRRDQENANAAILVDVRPEDFDGDDPLAGHRFQRHWERKAFELGGHNWRAPAQLAEDFIAGRPSAALGEVRPTVLPGVTLCDLRDALPHFVHEGIREALLAFGGKLRGFYDNGAVLTAIEARSSSPLRVTRDERGEASIAGVYPAGEGAGMAGGIMSSAVDGLRAAEKLAESL